VTISDTTRLLSTLILLGLIVPKHPAVAEAQLAANDRLAMTGLPTASSPTELKLPKLNDTEKQLLELAQSSKYFAARGIVNSQLQDNSDQKAKVESLQILAYLDFQLRRDKESIKDLQNALAQCRRIDDESSRSYVLILKRLADVYLKRGDKSLAVSHYQKALASNAAKKLDPNDPIFIGILEPLVGTLLQETHYDKAQTNGERLLAISKNRASSGNLFDIANMFWADLQLAEVYRYTNPELHEKFLSEMVPLFKQVLQLRAQYDVHTPAQEQAVFETLEKKLRESYIAQHKPTRLSDYLWLTAQFRYRSLPLIEWQKAGTESKAVILCIHGLGLENRAFGPFAESMITKNFTVYAMDVRGFGAWQSEYGSQTVSFDRTLADVEGAIKLIKKWRPGLPIFLLGESMGGAIALRATAEFGDQISGVIASVPSAKRYDNAKMIAQVALRFLRNPNRSFNIGTQITKQATSQEELRLLWKQDPIAKTDLSPIELIKFDRFMKTTKRHCSLIRSTPVMVVQGMADKLVKPKGTYEIFDSVNSSDKTMLILGNAEHLMFETPQQSDVLIDGLTAWLNNHLKKGSTINLR